MSLRSNDVHKNLAAFSQMMVYACLCQRSFRMCVNCYLGCFSGTCCCLKVSYHLSGFVALITSKLMQQRRFSAMFKTWNPKIKEQINQGGRVTRSSDLDCMLR